MTRTSGQAPFAFSLCEDLDTLPERAREHEVNLHGGFAVDGRPGGSVYYGMPGCGLIRISPDLRRQEVIELPAELRPVNFHSTRLVQFDGERRLVLPANDDEMVVVLSLDGALEFRLPRPEFEEYRQRETPFKPTDAAYAGSTSTSSARPGTPATTSSWPRTAEPAPADDRPHMNLRSDEACCATWSWRRS